MTGCCVAAEVDLKGRQLRLNTGQGPPPLQWSLCAEATSGGERSCFAATWSVCPTLRKSLETGHASYREIVITQARQCY